MPKTPATAHAKLSPLHSFCSLAPSSTTPDDAVFDGYTGLGVFRPHAYRYWFLHDEMILMLSVKERPEGILEARRSPNVRITIRDEYNRDIDPQVEHYLDEHFTPAGGEIWVRRN